MNAKLLRRKGQNNITLIFQKLLLLSLEMK